MNVYGSATFRSPVQVSANDVDENSSHYETPVLEPGCGGSVFFGAISDKLLIAARST